MKKLLLASTALIMSAGVAAADVALSGDARMGLIYDGNDVQMTSRARVTFTLSGETDTGLAFGASFRADQAGFAANGNTAMTGGTVFISGDFGKLTMGDVGSAARAAVGDLHGVGLTGLGDGNEMYYLDRDVQPFVPAFNISSNFTGLDRRTAALYEYSIDGFTGYAYVGQNRVVRFTPLVPDTGGLTRSTDQMVALGAKYTFDGFTGAVGYERVRSTNKFDTIGGVATPDATFTANHLIASVAYNFEGIEVKAIAGRASGNLGTALSADPGARRSQYGISASGTFDDVTVSAYAHRAYQGWTNMGIGASYDLGGGASVVGGIARLGGQNTAGSIFNRARTTQADLGLAFTF